MCGRIAEIDQDAVADACGVSRATLMRLLAGTRMAVGATSEDELATIIAAGGRKGEIYARLRDLRDRYADEIRRRYPKNLPRVSGESSLCRVC